MYLVELGDNAVETRLQRRKRGASAVKRVERESHDIDVRRGERAGDEDAAPEVVDAAGVPAVRDVHDDLRRRRAGAHAGRGGVQQLGRRVEAGLADLACGPQQPVVDLVADLDVVDGEARVLERRDEVERVAVLRCSVRVIARQAATDSRVDLRVEAVQVRGPPGGDGLVTGIGPWRHTRPSASFERYMRCVHVSL